MKIIYAGKNVNITDEMRDLTEKKMKRIDKYFHEELTADVVFSEFKDQSVVEITLNLPGTFIRAEEQNPDFRTALDTAVDRVARQVRKHKTKLSQRYRGRSTIRHEQFEELLNLTEEEPKVEEEKDIIREKTYDLRPMSEEEAILQMDLLDHNFFVFLNSRDDTVNVIYKRHAGGYGLLRPERF